VLSALDTDLPYEILNLGKSQPVPLARFISAIEKALGKKAKKKLLPIQPGDVPATWADIKKTTRLLGFRPTTDIQTGVNRFVDWYRSYYC
jgi:UDP-glucuronate 4-epimerase